MRPIDDTELRLTVRTGAPRGAEFSDPAPGARRALICAAEFPPRGGGGVLRLAKLAKYLPTFGWQLTVACSDEPLAEAVDRSLLEDIPDTVRVLRLHPPLGPVAARVKAGAKSRLGRRSPVFAMLISARAALYASVAIPDRWLPWALTLARRPAADFRSPDVVVTSGPPHSVHLAGVAIARRLRVPFVVDLRDEWSLRPLMRSRLPWRRVIDRLVEQWCLRRAAQVVVVSDTSARRYAALYPWLAGRLSVITNGFDPADFPDPDSTARNTVGEVLTLGYAGSFQVGLDLGPLFEAIGHVLAVERRNGPPVRFVMVGPFRREETDLAQRMIPDEVLSIQRFLPHREALRSMAAWDVLLVVINDGESSLAGKVYECLALRKPVLVVAPEGPATHLVAEAGVGVSAAPNDRDEISAALRRVLAMALDPSFRGAPDGFLARFDRRRQAQTWSELLGQVVDSHLNRRRVRSVSLSKGNRPQRDPNSRQR